MSVVRDDEAIAPAVVALPFVHIESGNLVRIPECRIDAVMDHPDPLVGYAVDHPEGIHGIIGYAMIDAVRESEDSALEELIEPPSPSSLVAFPEFPEDLMDRQDHPFFEYLS